MARRPGFMIYALLAAFVLGSVFPMYWSFVIGSVTKEHAAASTPPLVPGGHFVENARRVFHQIDFWSALGNSVLISAISAASVVFFSSLAGYAFAKLRFRGRDPMMVFIVATMTVPTQLALIPMLKEFSNMGLSGTRAAVILPWMVTAFGVFFMRQYLVDALPDELIEAARVDGASMFRIFWSIAVPAARPAMAILGLFTFMQVWTDFMWPLVVLQGSDVQTLQTALDQLKIAPGQGIADMALLQNGTIMATVPLFLLFIVTGRQLITGIMQGAIKG
jgi:cellobiose transport system permease protein